MERPFTYSKDMIKRHTEECYFNALLLLLGLETFLNHKFQKRSCILHCGFEIKLNKIKAGDHCLEISNLIQQQISGLQYLLL